MFTLPTNHTPVNEAARVLLAAVPWVIHAALDWQDFQL
jgi:hypothetical protein